MKSLRTNIAGAAFALASIYSAGADASQYPGQYHQIPSGSVVQHLSLVGGSPPNAGYCDGYYTTSQVMYAIDDWGHMESTPFKVPAGTVFLMTDVQAAGYVYASNAAGFIPSVSVFGGEGLNHAKAMVAGTALKGLSQETFAVSGSFNSAIPYPYATSLCARQNVFDSTAAATATLKWVRVQGILVNDLSW